MINPKDVLNAVQRMFIEDATMLGYLQLTTATTVEKAQGIIKRSFFTDLANSKSRLCIFHTPSRRTGNAFTTENILEINCHVPVSRDMYAYDVLQRAFLLLDERQRRMANLTPEIAYHLFRWDGMLGDLPTALNYFCAGARFSFISTMKNP